MALAGDRANIIVATTSKTISLARMDWLLIIVIVRLTRVHTRVDNSIFSFGINGEKKEALLSINAFEQVSQWDFEDKSYQNWEIKTDLLKKII